MSHICQCRNSTWVLLRPAFPLGQTLLALVSCGAIVDIRDRELRGEVAKSSKSNPPRKLLLFRISEKVRGFMTSIMHCNAYDAPS